MAFGGFDEVGLGVVAEHEPHPVVRPSGRTRSSGRSRCRLAAGCRRNRPAGTARSLGHRAGRPLRGRDGWRRAGLIQRLAGFGERDQQRRVTPDAVVGDVHALLCTRRRWPRSMASASIVAVWAKNAAGWRAHTFSRERLIASCSGHDRGLVEAAAEVPGRGRVGQRSAPQAVEEHLVVAAQLDVLQAPCRRTMRCRRCSARGRTRGRDGGPSASASEASISQARPGSVTRSV